MAARARDRGYENIELGIYEISLEEIAAQIKPYVDLKVHIETFTLKAMVFTKDGRQLVNDYPPDERAILTLCDQRIAEVYQRFTEALNTSRY